MNTTPLQRSIFVLIICLIALFDLSAQSSKKFTISGYVKEDKTGELLPGVSITVKNKPIGTATNSYGFFSITLDKSIDSVEIVFQSIGYLSIVKKISSESNAELEIMLPLEKEQLTEVVVEANKTTKISEEPQMSKIDIPVSQIKDIPALMGEKDVLKVIQLLPGVQKGSEGNSGIYVRGGGPDQNLIILDDAPVYNAFHLFGFFSLFNGDALKSVELTKGGFPAKYGGRLSSVIEMNMKDGSKKKFGGKAGIGLISSNILLEGPIVKDKSSFLISARRTYIDVLTRPLLPSDMSAGYYFYDINAKVNYELNKKNKLYLSGYFGKDKFYSRTNFVGDKSEFGLQWGNATGTLRWNHQFNDKIFANTSFIYSNYKFEIFNEEENSNNNYRLSYHSGIRDVGLKYDLDYYLNPIHSIKAGLITTYHSFTPSALVFKGRSDFDLNTKINKLESLESGFYIQDQFKASERFNILAGLRISNFITMGKVYTNPEPRFSASYLLKKDLSFKASYAMMNQYIHLLSNTGIGLPTDLWVPSTKSVSPQRSNQLALGLARDFTQHNFSVSLEGYYKKMDQVIGYKEGATFLLIEDPATQTPTSWEKNITSGQAWSYGAELLLKREVGKLTGWIGYTLSWTQLQFDSLNFGKKFYARYDRRHDISFVGIYKPTDNITLSVTWVYGTGNAITLPRSEYSANAHSAIPNNYNTFGGFDFNSRSAYDYGPKNSFRMAAYHRLDIGMQFHKKLSWGGIRTWEISIYNLYNRMNPYFYYLSTEQRGNDYVGVLKQITIFPFLPSISYNLKF
jgi:hypothetical protein